MSNYLKDLEDSRLLFRTFCDGLMYGMFFYHGETLHRVTSIEGLDDTVNGVYPIKECKPCLRSIPNLTEEERFQLERLLVAASYKILKGDYSYLKELLEHVYKNHIDLFGLIPKGLALEAPKGIYNT